MAVTKYAELDQTIIDHIRSNGGHPMYSSAVTAIARQLLGSTTAGSPKEWRLIDRRMQAMRKGGRLEYVRKTGGGHGAWRAVGEFREGDRERPSRGAPTPPEQSPIATLGVVRDDRPRD